jgi:hypothetical protein
MIFLSTHFFLFETLSVLLSGGLPFLIDTRLWGGREVNFSLPPSRAFFQVQNSDLRTDIIPSKENMKSLKRKQAEAATVA